MSCWGAEVWTGTRATALPWAHTPTRRPEPALHKCWSTAELWKHSCFLTSFPYWSLTVSFKFKPKKLKKQVIDSKRGKKERCTSAQPLVTAPNLYTHDPLCACVFLSPSNTHTHTRVSSQLIKQPGCPRQQRGGRMQSGRARRRVCVLTSKGLFAQVGLYAQAD